MTDVCYISPTAPTFSMRLVIDGKNHRVQFRNKELHLNPDNEIEVKVITELDFLIASKPNISQIIKKVDVEAAEAMARAHIKQLAAIRGTMTGPVSSTDAARAAQMAVQERDADLASLGASTEDLAKMREEMSEDNLVLTEDSKGVISESAPGFIPAVMPAPVDVPDEAPKVGAVFANLVKK